LVVALARKVQGLHDVEHLAVGDGGFGAALQGVAEIGVVVAVVGWSRWDATMNGRAVGVDLCEHAPVFFGIGAPWTFFRNVAEAEANFLGIEGILGEGGFVAEHHETDARGGGENTGAEGGPHVVGIVKKKVERVIGWATAFVADVGGNGRREAEKLEGMIDEVRTDIEKNAGAGSLPLAPGVGFEIGTEAVVVRFKADDAAERAGGGELEDALEVTIVAAALIHGEEAAAFYGELDEIESFGHGGGEGLVDEYVAARGEALVRERVVRFVWGGDDNEADFREGEEFVQGANDACAGIGVGGVRAGALQNGGEAQSGNGADYRSVESASCEAEADQANVDCVVCRWRGHGSKLLIERKRN